MGSLCDSPIDFSLDWESGRLVKGCIFGEDKPTNFKKDLEGESMLVRDGWMVLTLGEAISAQVVGHSLLESATWLVGTLGDFVKRRDRSGLEIEPWYAGRGLHIRGGMINISFEIIDLI